MLAPTVSTAATVRSGSHVLRPISVGLSSAGLSSVGLSSVGLRSVRLNSVGLRSVGRYRAFGQPCLAPE